LAIGYWLLAERAKILSVSKSESMAAPPTADC